MEDQKYQDIRTEFFKLAEDATEGYIISLVKIYEWLELELTDGIRQKLLQRSLRGDNRFIEAEDENDLDGHFIIRKDGKKSIPWFSCDGFKMFVMVTKSDKSIYIMKHFIQCERDYLRALKQSKEENNKELEDLREKCAKFDSTLLKIVDERNEFEFQMNSLQRENKRYHDIDRLMSCSEDDYSSSVNPDKIIAEYCKDHHWKKVYLYIVNPDYVNKPTSRTKKSKKQKKSENEIDLDDSYSDNSYDEPLEKIIPDTHIDDVTEMSMMFQHRDEHFYFTILTKEVVKDNYKKVGSISVTDKNHVAYIKDWFLSQSDCKTRFKNIFIASYENITSACNAYMANKSFSKYKQN